METNFKSQVALICLCVPLFLIFFFSSIRTFGQCIASSDLTGNDLANDGAGISFTGVSIDNLSSANGTSAVASVTLNLLGSAQTKYLKVTGFNFSIPSDATICGITVTVVKRSTSLIGLFSSVTDREVRLVKTNWMSDNNYKKPDTWQEVTYQQVTYGGASDLWGGTALTPADVNGSDFGVAISATFSGVLGAKPTAEIDKISMTVHYSVPTVLPVILHSFNTRLFNNTIQLNWSLAEQEEHASVTVQRSLNKKNWQDIYQHSLQNSTDLQYYQFKDTLHVNGDYAYRLKLQDVTGKITFSPVRTVRFNSNSSLNVYPIPAQSRLSVSSSEKIKEICVINLFQQIIKVPVYRLNDRYIELNIEQLPSGAYFVHTQKNVARFIKQ